MAPPDRPWKGIRRDILDAAGVTHTPAGLTAIPYRLANGTIHNRRLVAPSGRCWWETLNVPLIPLGLETIPGNTTDYALIVTEGESDCFAVREAFSTFPAGDHLSGFVVLGMPGASTWHYEWRRCMEGFDPLYVIGDGDEPGQKFAWDVKRSVPWTRPVRLPDGTDARRILQAEGPRALDPYLLAADRDAAIAAAFWYADTVDEFCALIHQPAFGLAGTGAGDACLGAAA